MSEPTSIDLRAGNPPTTMRILGILVGLNATFVMASIVVLGSVTKMIGSDWINHTTSLVLVMVGFIAAIVASFLGVFFYARRATRVTARFTVDEDEAKIADLDGGVLNTVPAAELATRPVQLYEKSDGQPFPAGPALEMQFGENRVIVVNRSIRGRWEGDVPTTEHADWSCEGEDWQKLKDALAIDEVVVLF